MLLICIGVVGILLSPSVGLVSGKELRSFTLRQVEEYPWGSAIASSQMELPFVRNQRGLLYMNIFIGASIGSVFCGVHWLAALRRKPLASQ